MSHLYKMLLVWMLSFEENYDKTFYTNGLVVSLTFRIKAHAKFLNVCMHQVVRTTSLSLVMILFLLGVSSKSFLHP